MVAAMLGKPLMAWQQHLADVILEIDSTTGQLAYIEWNALTPRQSGKSTFILSKATHRATATKFFGNRQNLKYTAQNRNKAREKWEEDFVAQLEAAPTFASRVKIERRPGHEQVRYTNGSRFGIESNKESSGHGDTLDEAFIDEAFAQVDNRLEDAFEPAMVTRRNHQIGVISTAGWLDSSPYLWPKVEMGRALVGEQLRNPAACVGVAYFEWSAPDAADPGLAETWLAAMPALHRPTCPPDCTHHTVTIAAVQAIYDKAARAGKLANFSRAYLNQWRKKPREGEETALGDWSGCGRSAVDFVFPKVVAIGVAVSPDRAWASIGAAGLLDDGRLLVGAVDRREGTAWLLERVRQIQADQHCAVVIDEGGPGKDLIETFEAAGIRVARASTADFVDACAGVSDRVKVHTVVHLRHPELDDAAEGARWKPIGDKRVLGRRVSVTDISMLEGAVLAAWAVDHAAPINPTAAWV